MKFAFTTLGCPTWDMDMIINKAVEYGYQGVDFRGYLETLDIYKTEAFTTHLEQTKKHFAEAGLEIPCFSSSIRLFSTSKEEREDFAEELEQYGQLCQHFNTPYVRVFGGSIGDLDREMALEIVAQHAWKLLTIAERYGITLLLETHDDWTDSRTVQAVIERVGNAHLQVLWDVHHPYRTKEEAPEDTVARLGEAIKYTHWKDSYKTQSNDRGYQLCLMGEGDCPFQRMVDQLKRMNYSGYYTLEWEKKWWPNIEEPEIAFKSFPIFMKALQ
ncbi:hypothetical protein GCM10011391_30140 [Pullulanibacillus camelliae]|uniref:Xylose isomerase-like TIM barrel domain-containing protein n=1 Tax=Pullulanibacillus camelliae TaxID=1707096 RepID=A0A8J2YKH6_9BACL|nr:sugar phosphate isomerase/epimerase family protein [Pullulanibacillus camelliae]GGE49290.1 hypothetical protein GCM10011391_30140 [Pullulanibacillus camelliae]